MKERDPYLDNIKFALIFFVVLGHYCGNYLQSWLLLGVYDFIYSFHMPLFIFITGLLSKHVIRQRNKDINNLLIPYFFIQLYMIIFKKAIGYNQDWSWAIPIEANWYLLGVFLWRLFVPFLNQAKHPIIIAFSLSLLVGFFYEFNEYLNLQRIITFSPFFVAGYFSESTVEFFKCSKKQNYLVVWLILSIALISFIGICYYNLLYGEYIRRIFIPYKGYKEWFGIYSNFGIIFRTIFFAIATIISYLFLYVIPKREVWFTSLGENILYIYLFHFFFIFLLKKYFVYSVFVTEFLALPVTIVITFFLANELIGKACNIMLNPLSKFIQRTQNVT